MKSEYTNLKKKFLNDGFFSYKNLIPIDKCNTISKNVKLPRKISSIFLKKTDYLKNPMVRKTNPGKGIENLAEEINLKSIEKNKKVQTALEKVLGKKYEIILKKFIIGVPKKDIPKWVLNITSKEYVGNLNKFIKKKYRKCTFFYGIDYHMDYIDVPKNKGNFITLYVYLNDVSKNSSPLNVVLKSHKYGATTFPHFIKKINKKKILYGKDLKNFKLFNVKELTGKTGDINFWSCYTLHGTKPMGSDTPRVSLRYLIKSKSNSKSNLMKNLKKSIKFTTELKNTRTDVETIKKNNKDIVKVIKGNRILHSN